MKYLQHKVLCFAIAGFLAAGCKKDTPPPAPEPPTDGGVGSSISLTGETPAVKPADGLPANTGPIPEIAVDFSSSAPEQQIATVVDSANASYFQAQGAAGIPKDAVELLNRAIQVYGERRQETDDGDGPKWPVITDLNQLVRYKILRALPAAPSGKKYALDPRTKVVSLAGK